MPVSNEEFLRLWLSNGQSIRLPIARMRFEQDKVADDLLDDYLLRIRGLDRRIGERKDDLLDNLNKFSPTGMTTRWRTQSGLFWQNLFQNLPAFKPTVLGTHLSVVRKFESMFSIMKLKEMDLVNWQIPTSTCQYRFRTLRNTWAIVTFHPNHMSTLLNEKHPSVKSI